MTELVDALYIDSVRLPIGRVRPDGFYSRIRADDMAVRTLWSVQDPPKPLKPDAIRRAALCAIAEEARLMLDEGVVA